MKEWSMNTISKQLPSTRQFFLVTLVLSAISFIPLIGWFSAFFLVIWLIGWILIDTRGFLSILWRIFLGLALIYSSAMIIDILNYPTKGENNNWLLVGTIGFALSTLGLVRSIVIAFIARSSRQ
jgi:hypothetical protein